MSLDSVTPTFVGPTAEEIAKNVDLRGKNIVITGANSGIGKESARVLLGRGAHVFICCRKVEDGKQVVEELAAADPSVRERAEVMQLDLESSDSIRLFGVRFEQKYIPLHVLLLNAGIMAAPQKTVSWTKAESQISVNHFGHFLLTTMLMSSLKAAGNARVVVVSSGAHLRAGVDLNDLDFHTRPYDKWVAYGQSKTANILFAKELNRRMVEAGLQIRANALHPGAIPTNLSRHLDQQDIEMIKGRQYAFKSIPQGAATQVWAAVAPELEGKGGLYLSDCAIAECAAWASDMEVAAGLWKLSEKACGVMYMPDRHGAGPAYPGFHRTAEDVAKNVDLRGKNVIVTGANSGIGKEAARVLLSRGAHVILCARKVEEGKQAVADFAAQDPTVTERAEVLALDLASDSSVKAFAAAVLAKNIPIHILMLNAGIMALKEKTLVPWCGFEAQFAVNHLGHFLLTTLLLDALKKAGNSRVVVLSSVGHFRSGVRFDDINFDKRPYEKFVAYGQSKCANILFAKELNRRMVEAGLAVRANAVHPGGIHTNLGRNLDQTDFANLGGMEITFKTVGQGAATQVWAAVAPELEGVGGQYMEDCMISDVLNPGSSDAEAAKRLWKLSEEVIATKSK